MHRLGDSGPSHGRNVTHKLLREHLVSGRFQPGNELALRIEQTLTQDATGTLVMPTAIRAPPERQAANVLAVALRPIASSGD